MTRRASSSVTVGVSHPKFIVGRVLGRMFFAVVPITDQEPRPWNEMRMSVSGGSSQLNSRLARFVIQIGANLRTKAFCCSVPSRNEIEITEFSGHLLSLTKAALVAPVVGAGASNHAKHH